MYSSTLVLVHFRITLNKLSHVCIIKGNIYNSALYFLLRKKKFYYWIEGGILWLPPVAVPEILGALHAGNGLHRWQEVAAEWGGAGPHRQRVALFRLARDPSGRQPCFLSIVGLLLQSWGLGNSYSMAPDSILWNIRKILEILWLCPLLLEGVHLSFHPVQRQETYCLISSFGFVQLRSSC